MKRPILPETESEEYEERSASEEEEEEPPVKKPASKKAAAKKTTSKAKKRANSDDEDDEEEEEEPAPKKRKIDSKGKAKAAKEVVVEEKEEDGTVVQTDKDGSKYIELSGKRRATVREFKGTLYLDIREFYEKAGEQLPGKKGISLNLEQWNTLKQYIDTIDSLFVKKK